MAKKKRKHLKRIVSEAAHDGSYVHHHTYEDPDTGAEDHRPNMATSDDADEAGQHVTDQFAMNQQPEQQQDPAATEDPTAEPGMAAS